MSGAAVGPPGTAPTPAGEAATGAGPGGSAPLVVVGAGISGLAAAWEASRAGVPVVVLEATERVGGVMARGELEVPGARRPLVVDLGPESLLARRREALTLLAELGLADQVVHPEPVPAAVATRGRLHALPPGTVMGAPRSSAALEGLLTPTEVARVQDERVEPLPGGAADVAVGALVAGRVGRAVVDRLVEPLLGGVYAGSAWHLSARATVPALWDLAVRGEPLLRAGSPGGAGPQAPGATAAGAPTTAGAPAAGPVFAGLRGGVARLAEELATRLGREGVEIRLRAPVTALRPLPPPTAGDLDAAERGGWLVSTAEADLRARAVVVALPAPAAARLLTGVVPAAARALARVRTASSALATVVVPGRVLAGVGRSGLLVPPVDGRTVKASTFSSLKWGWLAEASRALGDGAHADGDPPAVLRVSAGRAGEEEVLEREDADLLRTAADELGALLGGEALPVLAGRVDRWWQGLPQYDVGHLDLLDQVHAAVAGVQGLALAGSAYDGVGVPACVGRGRAAAREVLAGAHRGGPAAPVEAPAAPGRMPP
ncbi:protoporphyrinogen oxidase [Pseudokineococcus sp. 1T1Z-3]|uniref:protoporphyrinogen oxidase n=1 Tax=Pseudokineococcus sp. 1T1Z-3 TaxID=3132745 RepID=UPI0030AEBD08